VQKRQITGQIATLFLGMARGEHFIGSVSFILKLPFNINNIPE
jgi:hypothetical protein